MVQAMLGMAHQAQQAACQLQAGATTADPQDATTAATAATAAVADAEGRGGAVGGSEAAEGGPMQDSDDETEVDNGE
jgi:hypothetical protein